MMEITWWKKGPKNSGMGKPPPHFRAMPELKPSFLDDVFPYFLLTSTDFLLTSIDFLVNSTSIVLTSMAFFEVGAHLFFLKKKWRFFHRKRWHFKWITDVGENIGERKGDILGELLEIVTFLSPFLTPFSVKFFSPNKVTISSPKMVSFLVSHKNWWIFWWRKRWFSKWIADREKFFLSEKMSVRELRIHL